MSLTITQQQKLVERATEWLGQDIKNVSDILVPQHSTDWGFCFHPEYCAEVAEVEIYNAEGVTVLFLNASYEVMAWEFVEYTVENNAFLSY